MFRSPAGWQADPRTKKMSAASRRSGGATVPWISDRDCNRDHRINLRNPRGTLARGRPKSAGRTRCRVTCGSGMKGGKPPYVFAASHPQQLAIAPARSSRCIFSISSMLLRTADLRSGSEASPGSLQKRTSRKDTISELDRSTFRGGTFTARSTHIRRGIKWSVRFRRATRYIRQPVSLRSSPAGTVRATARHDSRAIGCLTKD